MMAGEREKKRNFFFFRLMLTVDTFAFNHPCQPTTNRSLFYYFMFSPEFTTDFSFAKKKNIQTGFVLDELFRNNKWEKTSPTTPKIKFKYVEDFFFYWWRFLFFSPLQVWGVGWGGKSPQVRDRDTDKTTATTAVWREEKKKRKW